jgi:hypothetical protein
MNQLTNQVKVIQELKSSLTTIQPNNSEITQTITYALIGAGIVGIMVYSYIKSQEKT